MHPTLFNQCVIATFILLPVCCAGTINPGSIDATWYAPSSTTTAEYAMPFTYGAPFSYTVSMWASGVASDSFRFDDSVSLTAIQTSPDTSITEAPEPTIFLGITVLGTGCLGLKVVSQLAFLRSAVVNIRNRRLFEVSEVPGFISQNQASFRVRELCSLVDLQGGGAPSLALAIRARRWVHGQQPTGDSWKPHRPTFFERLHGDIDDPIRLLRAMRQGAPATCRNFSFLMVAVLTCLGMRSRVVIVSATHWKTNTDGHIMTEVWIPELGKWVVMDAMWDGLYTVGGIPASALEVCDAAQADRLEHVQFVGIRSPVADHSSTKRVFRHLYVSMSNATFDGYGVRLVGSKRISFAHLVCRYSPRFPLAEQRIALVLSAASFLAGLIFCSRVLLFP